MRSFGTYWYKDCFVTHEGGCAFGFLIEEELYQSGLIQFLSVKMEIHICSLSCVTFRCATIVKYSKPKENGICSLLPDIVTSHDF